VVTAGVPRYSAAGSFVGYIGTSVDITERKLAEGFFPVRSSSKPTRKKAAESPGSCTMISTSGWRR
jgi:hypothetical protein